MAEYKNVEPLIDALRVCPTMSISKYRILGLIEELPVATTQEEIRTGVIDEFVERLKQGCADKAMGIDRNKGIPLYMHNDGTWHSLIDDIAKQLKEE